MSSVTAEMKARAEVYHGDETCREKFALLLTGIGFPDALLLTLQDIEECGYVKELGFVWLKHKKKTEHKLENNIQICYDREVTAYVEPNRIKRLTGVKAKEFLIWIPLSEICVKDPPAGNITFKTPTGLSRSFPLLDFGLPDDASRSKAATSRRPKKGDVAEGKVDSNGGKEKCKSVQTMEIALK